MSGYINLPVIGGGGSGAVDSVNGLTGVVVLTKSNIGLGNVNNTSDANKPVSTLQAAADAAVQAFSIQRANHTGTQDVSTVDGGINFGLASFGGSGVLESAPGYEINQATGGLNLNFTTEPNNAVTTETVHNVGLTTEPLANSPDDSINIINIGVNHDPSSSGFSFGTNGSAYKAFSANVTHNGTGDLGEVNFLNSNFALGNGTDPLDVRGFSYAYGFGTVSANVNINGPMQGYGYQPNINASATIGSGQYTSVFYDAANIGCPSPNYTSVNLSPNIAEIMNNSNYTGINLNPTIPVFSGNSNFNGFSLSSNLGSFGTGGFNGVNINPTISSAKNAVGVYASMDNVTVYAGVVASLVIQDLTIAADLAGAGANAVTIEYTGGGTAGAEVVSNIGLAFSVQIENGVSTATQIANALNAYPSFTINLNVTVSGTGSNPQVTQAATNLAGGIDAGNKKAMYADGDVEITGALTFGGALSIGKLNAFATQALADGGGSPASIHSLVSSPTVAANVTVANADTLGINTAMLLTMGDNSTVTTSFVGLAALALPAVVSMGSGSTIDQVSGGTFAVSLDGSATGGTIDKLDLCRSLAIPNGTTTITNLRGYKFDLPFGDPGVTSWGFYESPGAHNYFQGDLLIGGTAGSDDVVTNSSVALEIKSTTKAFVNARMSTSDRNALTAVNGMQIYNSTTDKLQVYAGGSWVDLH